MFIPVLLNIGVSYLWKRVDKLEFFILTTDGKNLLSKNSHTLVIINFYINKC